MDKNIIFHGLAEQYRKAAADAYTHHREEEADRFRKAADDIVRFVRDLPPLPAPRKRIA